MFDEIDKDIRAMMRGIQQQQGRVDADAVQIQILEDRLRTKAQMLRRDKEALIVAMYRGTGCSLRRLRHFSRCWVAWIAS